MDTDYTVCLCQLAPLEAFVTLHEQRFELPHVGKPPHICMVRVQFEDSGELQPRYPGKPSQRNTMVAQTIVKGSIMAQVHGNIQYIIPLN